MNLLASLGHTSVCATLVNVSASVRETVKALLVVRVPSRPVAELSQQVERSFSGNIHLGFHLEAQHGLLLQGVKLNLRRRHAQNVQRQATGRTSGLCGRGLVEAAPCPSRR